LAKLESIWSNRVVVRVKRSIFNDKFPWFIKTKEADNKIQENAKGSVLSLAAFIQYLNFTL
jgi:hypothetical protein